jgi:hypothetical protein
MKKMIENHAMNPKIERGNPLEQSRPGIPSQSSRCVGGARWSKGILRVVGIGLGLGSAVIGHSVMPSIAQSSIAQPSIAQSAIAQPAIAQQPVTQPPEVVPPRAINPIGRDLKAPTGPLPPSLHPLVIENLRATLGLPTGNAHGIKIIRSRPTTWQDCPPHPAALTMECIPAPQAGWQVTLRAQNQDWIYWVTPQRFMRLDAAASVNATVKAAIARRLNMPVRDLQVTAAELTTRALDCPPNASCMAGLHWGWRVLVRNSPQLFHLDWQGGEWPRGLAQRTTQAGLPLQQVNAVMRDVADRGPATSLRVERIKAIAWNWCRSTGSPERPTPPEMGACANITQNGWQMVVRSGPMRYVYYLTATGNAVGTAIAPDGLQSLPSAVRDRVIAAATQQSPYPNFSIQGVEARFFDRCLGEANPSVSCRQGIRAGWQMMAIGQSIDSNGRLPAWTYHTDTLGLQTKLIQTGFWAPPPMAPPPRG